MITSADIPDKDTAVQILRFGRNYKNKEEKKKTGRDNGAYNTLNPKYVCEHSPVKEKKDKKRKRKRS